MYIQILAKIQILSGMQLGMTTDQLNLSLTVEHQTYIHMYIDLSSNNSSRR